MLQHNFLFQDEMLLIRIIKYFDCITKGQLRND